MKMIKALLLVLATVALIAGGIALHSDVAFAGTCPSAAGCGCNTAYAPVLCGKQKCRYLNSCHARCAGWSYTQCVDGNPN